METPIRAAVIGLAHESVWTNVERALALPDVKLIGAADQNEAALARFARMTDLPEGATYTHVDDLFNAGTFDAVIGGLLPIEHVALVELCANRDLPLLIGQPVATALEDTDRIVADAQRSGIRLLVDHPRLWNPALREATRRATQGAIGSLRHARFRSSKRRQMPSESPEGFERWLFSASHNPTGAYLDCCADGALFASWALGNPSTVTGVGGATIDHERAVFSNALFVATYPDALLTAEGSWTDAVEPMPHSIQFFGDKGMIAVTGKTMYLYGPDRAAGEAITPPPLPEGRRNAVEHFFHSLRYGQPIDEPFGLASIRDAQEILEAGRRSIETGFECPLPVR